MERQSASRTALGTAYIRAYHLAHVAPPIFADPLAARCLTAEETRAMEDASLDTSAHLLPDGLDRAAALAVLHRTSPSVPVILARARYNEDILSAAIDRGLIQYVLLGAGLDTLPWRRPELAARLQVFELDRPASQEFARERFRCAGLEEPPNLHFAAIDFEREKLSDALARLPFDAGQPTHFAWLGVIPYLTREATEDTVTQIRTASCPTSILVFDYPLAAAAREPRAQALDHRLARQGEPIVSRFEPAEMAELMVRMGFEMVEDLGPDEYGERYFADRVDGFRPKGGGRIAHARVA
jgi:methyltransferase (TIGR00027 family)